jgi:transcriptional regulator with XRE-family HTH domain
MSANNEGVYNEDIRAAIRYLYGEGVISSDKDIAEKVGLSKSTISPYLKGKEKASGNFRTKFEEAFDIKLARFGDSNGQRPEDIILSTEGVKRTLADYLNMIENYNKTMSNAINAGLIQIKVNLEGVAEKLGEMDQSMRVNQNIMIGSLEEIAGKSPGTLLKEGDTLERGLDTLKKEGDTKKDARKKHKQ